MTLLLYEGVAVWGNMKVVHTDKDGNVKRELHRYRVPGEGMVEVDFVASEEQ